MEHINKDSGKDIRSPESKKAKGFAQGKRLCPGCKNKEVKLW
jgi:hypothetical protein